jgi:catalase
LSQNPESIHQLFFLFGDRGTPLSFRHMHGWVGHTMKWVNAKGEWKYVQIHYESDLGFKTHTAAEAAALDGSNPDSATQDLFEAIARKEYPTWTVSVQTMTAEQAAKFRYSVNDLTKVRTHVPCVQLEPSC